MKKTLIFICAGILAMSLVSCGQKPADTPQNTPEAETSAPAAPAVESPVALLTAVWNQYTEDEKFPVIGGDFDEANNNADGPGRYGITDVDALDATLVFPAASVDKLEDAASLLHMMNANTFTAAAFRVKAEEDAAAVAAALTENVRNRQWVCGMPDKFAIYTLGQDVVLILGEQTAAEAFSGKFAAQYPDAVKVVDEEVAVN